MTPNPLCNGEIAAFARAMRFTEAYDAPVPSQFAHLPRASARDGDEWSLAAYQRATTADMLAMAGNLDASL